MADEIQPEADRAVQTREWIGLKEIYVSNVEEQRYENNRYVRRQAGGFHNSLHEVLCRLVTRGARGTKGGEMSKEADPV